MSSRKKVLIVAYYFPPSGGPGVQRVLKFVKYLPEFGWDPVVLTVRDGDYPAVDESLLNEVPPQVPVIRTKILEPYTLYRRFTGKAEGEAVDVNVNRAKDDTRGQSLTERAAQWIRGAFFVPDARVGWLLSGTQAGIRAAKEHGADLVYSSSPPYTCALLGRRIARGAEIPWVPEFRDPWSGFLSAPDRPALSTKIEANLERGVYRDADRIVIAWQGIARDLKRKFPGEDAGKFRLVENGFDPDDLRHETPVENPKFTMVYTGSMYGVRNPDTVLRAAALLAERGAWDPSQVCLRFVGRFGADVHAMFERPEVRSMVDVQGYRPHAESIAECMGAHALLLVVDSYEGDDGIVPGKVFEYIGCRRPLLALAPKGAVADIVAGSQSGVVLSQDDVEGTARALEALYGEWKQTGETRFQGLAGEVDRLSRRERTKDLSNIFMEVVEAQRV